MLILNKVPKLEQGDLLYVTLTGSTMKNYRSTPTTGKGWLLITEVSTDGEVISANFKPGDSEPAGYGQVMWPVYDLHAFLRGPHGECSPFAAISRIFGNKVAAIALT